VSPNRLHWLLRDLVAGGAPASSLAAAAAQMLAASRPSTRIDTGGRAQACDLIGDTGSWSSAHPGPVSAVVASMKLHVGGVTVPSAGTAGRAG
jgi:hypothetical protein